MNVLGFQLCCVRSARDDEVTVGFDGATFATPRNSASTGSTATWQERKFAVCQLGSVGPYGALHVVPRLEEALLDEHWQVRRQAANSLRKLGAEAVKQALPALWDACNDCDNLVSAAAVHALKAHGEPLPHCVSTAETKLFQSKESGLSSKMKETAVPFQQAEEMVKGMPVVPSRHPEELESNANEFLVILGAETGQRGRLGVDIDFGHPMHLKIKKLNTGLVSEWNLVNPTKRIEVGDCFFAINGARGDSRRLMEIIAVENELKIVVRKAEALSNCRSSHEI